MYSIHNIQPRCVKWERITKPCVQKSSTYFCPEDDIHENGVIIQNVYFDQNIVIQRLCRMKVLQHISVLYSIITDLPQTLRTYDQGAGLSASGAIVKTTVAQQFGFLFALQIHTKKSKIWKNTC